MWSTCYVFRQQVPATALQTWPLPLGLGILNTGFICQNLIPGVAWNLADLSISMLDDISDLG